MNTLAVTLRGLRRNLSYTFLNGVGLALGMACVLLIGLYVLNEVRYDRFHAEGDRIAWITADLIEDGERDQINTTQGILGPLLAEDISDVEAVVRLNSADPLYVVDGKPHRIDGVRYADASLFEVFDGFEALHGVLDVSAPGNVVVTESLARRLFGRADVVGETLQGAVGPQTISSDEKPGLLTITGVMADPPTASTLQFPAVVASSTMDAPEWMYESWRAFAFDTYVKLRPGVSVEAFEAQLPGLVADRATEAMGDDKLELGAVPLFEARLRSERPGTRGTTTLWAFGTVGLFVLLLACVNFTNLATARSLIRAREVGVRKTLGAGRGGLTVQFLSEAIVMSLLSLGLALILVQAALPWAETVVGTPLALGSLGLWLIALAGIAVVTGVLAGAYPAFVLARFRPVDVLKGQFSTGRKGTTLQRGLVLFQFTVTVILLLGTATVFAQLHYMQTTDLGFGPESESEQLVTLDFDGDEGVAERVDVVKTSLEAIPGVTGVTASITRPAGGQPLAGGGIEAPDGTTREMSVNLLISDADFSSVYSLRLLAGREPRMALGEEASVEYLLNESALREAGYASAQDVLGKSAGFWGFEGTVVGVVRDFHTQGFQTAIGPLAVVALPEFQSLFTLRVRTDNMAGTLDRAGEVWAELAPAIPYEPTFIDDAVGALYETERRFGRIFGLFAGLAVLIACLGLFGLAAHASAQRRKEIGVRRVLGATVSQVVRLLTRETLALVGLAIVIGVPIAVVLMERWLDDFAYRTTVGVGTVGMAALIVVTVAAVTVGVQALRAATADPIRTLRAD
ncbi:MAG: ABC transporter permease [Bacteroidota bacterium]